MSGSKRITVDRSDWQRAQTAAAKLREVNRNLPSMLESMRRDQQEQLGRATAAIQARQDAVERSLAGLSEQTKKLEAQTSRRLRAHAAALRSELQDATRKLDEETRRSLDEQEERLRSELAREREERERDYLELRDGLAGIAGDRVADARLLAGAIAGGLPHERFAPGRLAALQQRLALAEGNLASGAGEAALSLAQELCLQLDELRSEVEMRDQEWRVAQLAAMSASTMLQEQIRVNSSVDVTDEQGNRINGVMLDVDFWSEGELTELRDQVATLAGRVASEADPLTLAELRAVAGQEAPDLDERLTAIVGRAGARQFASQVRANLAELVVTTLEDTTGFVWEEGQAIYAGEDPRRAFYSKLRHLDDSEIVVEVAPDEDGESCVLRILSYDSGTPDEEERARRVHVIADRLRDRGLQVGNPAAEQAEPDPALADFNGVRLRVPESRPESRPDPGTARRVREGRTS
jgi:myosin heavy subunit